MSNLSEEDRHWRRNPPTTLAPLTLRNYPDDNAKNYSKAWSFSPDIIPLYGTEADVSALVEDASWRGFTGMPIVGGHLNNVYIRGYGAGGPHVAYLRAVPSELILWPQVWSDVKPVSSGPVVIPAKDNQEARYASDGHLQFRPPHTTGHTYSLVAHVFKHDPTNEDEPKPASDPQRSGVDGLIHFLSQDNKFTFYNVVVADPTLKHVSATTRLRIFDRGQVELSFSLSLHKGTRSDGLQVSLVDDHGDIIAKRTEVSSFGERKFRLKASYDGILTLNIFSPPGQVLFEPYSGFSLQVSSKGHLLGALNIIFEHHSTRNLRFASHSETKLRECECGSGKDGHHGTKPSPPSKSCGPIPATKPAATGWWFRAQLNDTNDFPHPGPGGYSPDIQPAGTDVPSANVWDDIQNPGIDYSAANAIELVGGERNYVFVRGHSTIADIDIQSRIFTLDGSAFLHPSQYQKEGYPGQALNGTGTVVKQSISVTDDNQFYVFSMPFTVEAPGDAGNHYCFVAEVRQKRKCCLVYPTWSSEQEEDFATITDFANWVLSCPLVCWRNINWVPGPTGPPDGNNWPWCCTTQLIIPECGSYCTFWSIIIECDSPFIPAGSTWSLKCDDNTIFPNGICFEDCPIDTNSPAFKGCHFTGAPPRYRATLTLCVNWCDSGKKFPLPRIKCRLAMTDAVTNLSPIKHIAVDPPAGSDSWPFVVTKNYPYLDKAPQPSPLPWFKSAGIANEWPYPGVPNFVFGQVSLAAKTK